MRKGSAAARQGATGIGQGKPTGVQGEREDGRMARKTGKGISKMRDLFSGCRGTCHSTNYLKYGFYSSTHMERRANRGLQWQLVAAIHQQTIIPHSTQD